MLKELNQKEMENMDGGAEMVVSYTILGRTIVIAYDLQDGKDINLGWRWYVAPSDINGTSSTTTSSTTTTSSGPTGPTGPTSGSSSSVPDYSNPSIPPYAV